MHSQIMCQIKIAQDKRCCDQTLSKNLDWLVLCQMTLDYRPLICRLHGPMPFLWNDVGFKDQITTTKSIFSIKKRKC